MKTLSLGRLGLGVLAVILTVGAAIAANDLTISSGTKFIPGPRLIDGNDLNVMLGAVNKIQDQIDGTAAIPGCPVTTTGATPVTCNGTKGAITTTTLTTAALNSQVYVINNNLVSATSVVDCSMMAFSQGFTATLTTGIPVILGCAAGTGTISVTIGNLHATQALNGTLKIGFTVVN
jgi:hypothetical protein